MLELLAGQLPRAELEAMLQRCDTITRHQPRLHSLEASQRSAFSNALLDLQACCLVLSAQDG
jgi:hypothetical protein